MDDKRGVKWTIKTLRMLGMKQNIVLNARRPHNDNDTVIHPDKMGD
jgi:hypothetical protein